jgi:septal ring factor EnvC (AmiA/AmiB activator)
MGQEDIEWPEKQSQEIAKILAAKPEYYVPPRTRREHEEEHTPLWVKIFGGSILSIAFLCVITLTGYIVSNMNSIQSQINTLNAETITKKEFADRQKSIWDSQKTCNDSLGRVKECLNAIDVLAKERQLWLEKHEAKIADQAKSLDNANKEIAAQKERANSAEAQLKQMREEYQVLQKDMQSLRERVAAIEGKKKEE